jgi:hypothetical protein
MQQEGGWAPLRTKGKHSSYLPSKELIWNKNLPPLIPRKLMHWYLEKSDEDPEVTCQRGLVTSA